jgi:hypothetical protein
MEHQGLHLIIASLVQQPKCELTPNEHSMYIRFLWNKVNLEIYGIVKILNNEKKGSQF